jgi:hypothetical protein
VVDSTPTHEAAKSRQSPASVPRHRELRYVYEVDAVDMPVLDSHAVPEYEPEVYVSTGTAEALDDDALPFEARTERKSGVRSSGSEKESGVQSPESQVRSSKPDVQGAGPGAPLSSKQPRLFDGSDE